ncbi:MAG: hypothetical protein ACYCZR_08920, partial [Burkholderiales bacterium]
MNDLIEDYETNAGSRLPFYLGNEDRRKGPLNFPSLEAASISFVASGTAVGRFSGPPRFAARAGQERGDRSNTAASAPAGPSLHGPEWHCPARSSAMVTTIDSIRALARALAGAAGLVLAGAV